MTLYKHEVQFKVATPLIPSGVYYWTNVWYFKATTPTEFENGEQWVFNGLDRMHCQNVVADRRRLTRLDTGAVVANGTISYPIYNHWGLVAGPITATLLLWLYAGNTIAGFKRIRMPVPPYAHDAGRLTEAFISDYKTNGLDVGSGSLQCNRNGVAFTSSKLDPYVRGWQLRHGTKRAARRVIT